MEEASVEPRLKRSIGSEVEGREAGRSSRKGQSSSGQPPPSSEEATWAWRFLAGNLWEVMLAVNVRQKLLGLV